MIRLQSALRRLARSTKGSMAIETALIAPVLVLMSLGSFEISRMVARQHELQSGALEAEAIALAANAGASTNTTTLKSILMSSLGLTASQVTVLKMYRCDRDDTLVTDRDDCGDDSDREDRVSTYVRLTLTDSYTPIWRRLGIAGNYTYNVVRTVQLS